LPEKIKGSIILRNMELVAIVASVLLVAALVIGILNGKCP
jgi:hypothetical protein